MRPLRIEIGTNAFKSSYKLFKPLFVGREQLVLSTCVYCTVTNDKKAISRAVETIGESGESQIAISTWPLFTEAPPNLRKPFLPIDLPVPSRSTRPCLIIISSRSKNNHRPSFHDPWTRCSGKWSSKEDRSILQLKLRRIPFSVFRKGHRKRDPLTLIYRSDGRFPIREKRYKNKSIYRMIQKYILIL